MTYQTVLVAFVVKADTPEEAQDILFDLGVTSRARELTTAGDERLDQWWVAHEDSFPVLGGNEAAVFMPNGMKYDTARRILEFAHELLED